MKNFSEQSLNSIQKNRDFDLQLKILKNYYSISNQADNIDKKFFIKKITRLISKENCANVINYFFKYKSYSHHVPDVNKSKLSVHEHKVQESDYSSYESKINFNCKSILHIATNKKIMNLVRNFLGDNPKIYSINTFWTYPKKKKLLTHKFHRDPDDFRFLTLFIYWTPIKKNDGAQSYIENTSFYDSFNDIAWWKKLIIIIKKRKFISFKNIIKLQDGYFLNNDDYKFLFKNKIKSIVANEGDVILANTNNLHKGSECKNPRLITWIRYGLYKNYIYKKDNLKKVNLETLNKECKKIIKNNYELFEYIINQ
jgi:hypothetical protein